MRRLHLTGIDPSGATAGQVPTYDSDTDTFLPATPARGVAIAEEGAPVATEVTTLDFHGASVTAAPGSAGVVTVTVTADPGGGSGGSSGMALVPLTTVIDGVPQLVWESDDSLALTEVSR